MIQSQLLALLYSIPHSLSLYSSQSHSSHAEANAMHYAHFLKVAFEFWQLGWQLHFTLNEVSF